jgi:carboxyl-terminal processing protease
LLVGLIATPAAAGADAESPLLAKWRKKAREFEKSGAWLAACRWYEEALRKNSKHAPTREAYQLCLRRLQLLARHRDPAYRLAVSKFTPPQSLDLYEQVLGVVTAAYVDKAKTDLTALFQHGLRELRLALEEEAFRRRYLAGVRPEALAGFKARLAAWPARKIHNRAEAREQLLAVLQAARKEGVLTRQGLFNVFALEFAAGACNALDHYSSFLSPGQHGSAQAALRGKSVGVGVELVTRDGELRVGRVWDKSPAKDAEIAEGDRVLRINRQAVDHVPAETAAERLRGEPGSLVEVEFERPADDKTKEAVRRVIRMERRPVATPSVEHDVLPLEGGHHAGYLRINHFQDSTLQDVKEALLAIHASPETTRGLILDLRGNPGGLFKSAVQVAELFLPGGVIVHGQSPHKEYNRTFKAEGLNPLLLPMVVLVDGDTASAAEVLAGALKEQRGSKSLTQVVGQTTYGKGSVQCVFPVDKVPPDKLPGIRLTVARLLSPSGNPYTGQGVAPDQVAIVDGDAGIARAKEALQKMLPAPMSPMPPMPAEGPTNA